MENGEWKLLTSVYNLQEAQFLKLFFEEAGIPVKIFDENINRLMPYIGQGIGGMRIMTRDFDLPRAQKKLLEFEAIYQDEDLKKENKEGTASEEQKLEFSNLEKKERRQSFLNRALWCNLLLPGFGSLFVLYCAYKRLQRKELQTSLEWVAVFISLLMMSTLYFMFKIVFEAPN